MCPPKASVLNLLLCTRCHSSQGACFEQPSHDGLVTKGNLKQSCHSKWFKTVTKNIFRRGVGTCQYNLENSLCQPPVLQVLGVASLRCALVPTQSSKAIDNSHYTEIGGRTA
eukprot:4271182-Amphidinium_carterae.1